MNAPETIEGARARIATIDTWHKGSSYGDADGKGLAHGPASPKAARMCANAALYEEAWARGLTVEDAILLVQECRRSLTRALPQGHDVFASSLLTTLTSYNDAPSTKHGDILALFDNAAKRLRAAIAGAAPTYPVP